MSTTTKTEIINGNVCSCGKHYSQTVGNYSTKWQTVTNNETQKKYCYVRKINIGA